MCIRDRNTQNECHQWLSYSSRVTKFVLGGGSAPDSAGGAYSVPPYPLAGLRALLLKGGEGKGRKWGRGGEDREKWREWKERGKEG